MFKIISSMIIFGCLIPAGFARNNFESGLNARFSEKDPSLIYNSTYYYKPKPLYDYWEDRPHLRRRKHNFKRWEYEVPRFDTADLHCPKNSHRVRETHGGSSREVARKWDYICGYNLPPKAVKDYYSYARPFTHKRPPVKKRFKRRGPVIRYEAWRNY